MPDDQELLERWDGQPHVIESDPNDDWNWSVELARAPEWREQLMAEVEGEPIGFVQIIDPRLEESHYWGEVESHLRAIDIWIGEEKHLGRGYGTQMMKLAIERCFSDRSVKGILIDPLASNRRAIKFYEKFDFVFVENRQFGQDYCHVMRLDRESVE